MNEARTWDVAKLPGDMLHSIKNKYDPRKIRLYACAWFRQIASHLEDPRGMRAVEVAERFADGQASEKELKAASTQASRLRHESLEALNAGWRSKVDSLPQLHRAYQSATAAWEAARPACRPAFLNTWHDRVLNRDGHLQTDSERREAQAAVLAEVFGNPFRPITIESHLRTALVVSLGQAAYDERQLPAGTLDPVRLTVLADALEEAGCTDVDILGHLRSAGPHVRGCWALDLVLDKA